MKVNDDKCKAAYEWWTKNKSKWEIVRIKWDEIYGRNKNLSLKRTVDNTPLFMKLFDDAVKESSEIDKTIELYIND